MIRAEMRRSRFRQYEIAAAAGYSETAFSRMLRYELTAEQLERVRDAVALLAQDASYEE
ncbi:MAG: hypothetical protein FWG72_04540 [Oscillospiraceae bacterium]|nr:hypothetical protein [Oscillospiraceae bacterium]